MHARKSDGMPNLSDHCGVLFFTTRKLHLLSFRYRAELIVHRKTSGIWLRGSYSMKTRVA